MACHGPGGNSVTPGIPSIAGQPKLFLENQLVLIREELRPSPQMLPVVQGMKDAEIEPARRALLEAAGETHGGGQTRS